MGIRLRTFLDISSQVNGSQNPGGLLDLFHPNYKQNGFFYLSYINKNDSSIVSDLILQKILKLRIKTQRRLYQLLKQAIIISVDT